MRCDDVEVAALIGSIGWCSSTSISWRYNILAFGTLLYFLPLCIPTYDEDLRDRAFLGVPSSF